MRRQAGSVWAAPAPVSIDRSTPASRRPGLGGRERPIARGCSISQNRVRWNVTYDEDRVPCQSDSEKTGFGSARILLRLARGRREMQRRADSARSLGLLRHMLVGVLGGAEKMRGRRARRKTDKEFGISPDEPKPPISAVRRGTGVSHSHPPGNGSSENTCARGSRSLRKAVVRWERKVSNAASARDTRR